MLVNNNSNYPKGTSSISSSMGNYPSPGPLGIWW